MFKKGACMKKVANIFLLILFVLSAVVFSACDEAPVQEKAQKIQLSQSEITLLVGEVGFVDVEIIPGYLPVKDFEILGGNDDVATAEADIEGMRIVIRATEEIVEDVKDTWFTVQTTDGSFKQTHLSVHIATEDQSVETPKNFTLDGNRLVWQEVDDANGYTISINDEARVIYTNYFTLDFNELSGQSIVAKVKANGETQNLDSPYTSELKFAILDKPSNVRFDDSTKTLSWDAVENATSYAVSVNNRLVYASGTELLIEEEVPAGYDCVLKVRANGNSAGTYINSSFSEAITLKKLGAPTTVTITNGIVTWSTISGATGYQISCSYKKDGEDVEDVVRVRGTIFTLPFDIDAGIGKVKVKAIGNGTVSMTSDYGIEKTFLKLAQVKNLRVEDGIILWDSVNLATNYTIILENVIDDDGNTRTITYSQTGSSSILSYDINSYPAGTYYVNVQANGSSECLSSKTLLSPLVVTKLSIPANLQATKIDGVCKVRWQNNPKANGWMIYLKNSQTVSYNVAKTEGDYVEYSFNGTAMEVGDNLISVKALGSDATEEITYINSDITDEIAIKKLAIPTINMGKIKSGVVSWQKIKYVGSYELIVKDFSGALIDKYTLTTTSIDFNSSEYKLDVGNYQFTIKAVAPESLDNFDDDIYDAIFDGETSSIIKICKLSTKRVKVENGTVQDLTPQGNYSYSYIVTYENGNTSPFSSAHSFVENDIQDGERVSIEVQAVSNKDKDDANIYYISSDLSQKLYVRKLPSINDISMQSGIIEYGAIFENYSGYEFNIVVNETEVKANGTSTVYDFSKVSAGYYTVRIKAVSIQNGDGLSEDINNPLNLNGRFGREYSFQKLSAPQDLSVSSFASSDYQSFKDIAKNLSTYSSKNSGSLVWSKITNATSYQLIFDQDEENEKVLIISESEIFNDENPVTNVIYHSLQQTDISNGEHSIIIKSLGNGTNIIDSEKSLYSVHFTKFKSPDSISLNDGILTWTYSNQDDNPNKIVDINNPYLKNAIFLIVDTNGNCFSTLSNYVDGKLVSVDANNLTLAKLQEALQLNCCLVPSNLTYSTSLSVVAVPLNTYIKTEDLDFEFTDIASRCVVSEFSQVLNVEPLVTPFNLKMENNVISWSPIRNDVALKEYKLNFKNGDSFNETILFRKGSPTIDTTNKIIYVDDIADEDSCSWRFNKQNFELMFGEDSYNPGNYQITIQAVARNVSYNIGDELVYYINSSISTSKQINLLSNPVISLKNGVINWSTNTNVRGYWIYISRYSHDTEYIEIEANSHSLEFGEFYQPGVYYFNAIALGDGKNTVSSEFSFDNEKSFEKLQKVTGLRIENGLIVYDQHQVVADSTNNCVYNLNYGGKEHLINYENVFPSELGAGENLEHIITVFARGDNTHYISSDITGPCAVDNLGTLPRKLASPNDIHITDGKLYWNRIEGVNYYKITISNGVEYSQNQEPEVDDTTIETTYDLTYLCGGTYKIVVQAIGNNVYINSNEAQSTIKKLPEITNLHMEDGYVVWKYNSESSETTNKYSYRVVVNGETEIQLTSANSEIVEITENNSLIAKNIRYNLADYETGEYLIYIYDFGGATAISSSVTETFTFEKLPSPQSVKVKDDNLLFTDVENATNYEIYFTVHLKNETSKNYKFVTDMSKYELIEEMISNTISRNRAISFNEIRDKAISALQIVDSNIDYYTISVLALGSSYDDISSTSGQNYYIASNHSYLITIKQSPTPIIDYETYDYTNNNAIVEKRFNGRIYWGFDTTINSSEINFYRVYVKSINPDQSVNSEHSVLFGYDLLDGKVDEKYPDFKYYIVRGRRYANVAYTGTYEFFVVACQDENGFDSLPSNVISDLSYGIYGAGQDGSSNKPFEISYEYEFNAMKYNLDANYVLKNNMVFTTVPESIGTDSMPFNGKFDGAGYTICGSSGALVVNSRNTTFAGLFGVIGEGGIVTNFTFNAQINATTGRQNNLIQVSPIAVKNYGTISDIEIQGIVSSEYNLETTKVQNAGVAIYNYGTISRAVSKAIINPKNSGNDVYAGGISIFNYGTIEKSGFVGEAYGQVVGGITAQNLGGLIAQCYYEENSSSTIIKTSNKGLSINMAGGLVGYMTGGKIYNCYSTGKISGSTNTIPVYVGGLVGYINNGTIKKSYVVAAVEIGGVVTPIISATGSTLTATKVGVFAGVSNQTSSIGSNLICIRTVGQSFAGSGTVSAQEVSSIQNSLTNADLNKRDIEDQSWYEDGPYFNVDFTYPTLIRAKYLNQ